MRPRRPVGPVAVLARHATVLAATAGAAIAAAGLATVGACVDESHELQVDALGGEAAGVPRGPTHRPGQPCLVCHGGLGPASRQFVMAGTIYATQGQPGGDDGASVQIEDVDGSYFTATSNVVGNFFITTDQWSPTYPAQVVVTQGQNSQQMVTHIGRDGSCADCHMQPPSPTSPGPVYLVAGAIPDGGL
jgi:hypothetical protein